MQTGIGNQFSNAQTIIQTTRNIFFFQWVWIALGFSHDSISGMHSQSRRVKEVSLYWSSLYWRKMLNVILQATTACFKCRVLCATCMTICSNCDWVALLYLRRRCQWIPNLFHWMKIRLLLKFLWSLSGVVLYRQEYKDVQIIFSRGFSKHVQTFI